MAPGHFTLAQLARAAGMSLDDVRSFRDQNLLQPPLRRRGRQDHFTFRTEHFERLQFIKPALDHGFTTEDIAQLVDPAALMTCGDVYAIASHRLEELRKSVNGASGQAAVLERLLAVCARAGSKKDCKILQALSEPNALTIHRR